MAEPGLKDEAPEQEYPSELERATNLTSGEIRILKEFFDSPEWRIFHELEKGLIESARHVTETAHDLHTLLRAQGVLEGFRRRDAIVQTIHDIAVMTEKEANE